MVGRCWHVYRRQSVAKAEKLLHAWAKLHKEDNDLTNGDMSLMLFKWTTELAFIRAKFLVKCILERAAL